MLAKNLTRQEEYFISSPLSSTDILRVSIGTPEEKRHLGNETAKVGRSYLGCLEEEEKNKDATLQEEGCPGIIK